MKEAIINLTLMVLVFCFLLTYFKPSLLLSKTITSGGDTASHFYPAQYLKDHLLPKGKIVGWSPGWYAGLPLFQFYFFLPFLIMVFLSYTMPLQIAFKIVTVLGTFLLPIAAFFSMKMMKFKFPAPIIAAVFALPFLFMEANSMWGGNIPSTLAGEFSYSLSLALTVLLFGSLYSGMESKKLLISNSILFALIFLTHVYTAAFVALSSIFFILRKGKLKENFEYLFKLYLLSFLLVSFWLIPLLLKRGYSSVYHYIWILSDLSSIFPKILLPFFLLTIFGVFLALRKRDERVLYLTFSLLVSAAMYRIAPFVGLTDIRFIPFLQLFSLFIAAYTVAKLFKKTRLKWITPLIILVLTAVWVKQNVSYIPTWIAWNYEGFEGKAAWNQFKQINDYLASLPPGRVMHEYSNSHNKFGTPRAFESIPLFADKPVLEGLYIEGAISSPFVFNIQSELSETSTCPIPGLICNTFDVENGTKHLKLFNVNYVVATSEKLKNSVKENKEYTFLKKFDDIEIYKINATGYVTLPEYEPILFKTDDWKGTSLEWFRDADEIDVPLVFVNKLSREDVNRFKIVSEDLTNLTKIPIVQSCSVEETVKEEEIDIKTSCIGKPLLVKVPYFPNWQVEGADKIYLASPSFMLIFPEKENIRLYYGYAVSDYMGITLSLVGLCLIFYFKFLSKT